MTQDKQKNLEKSENTRSDEKTSDHNKLTHRFVLVLVFLLVASLIISMFFTNSSKQTKNTLSDNNEQSIPATNFAEQVRFEQDELNAAKLKNESTPGFNTLSESDNDTDWDRKEDLRVLNSRTAGFGIDSSEQSNNLNINNSVIPNNNNLPTQSIYQSLNNNAHTQQQYVNQFQQSQTINNYNGNSNIVGKAADTNNPDAHQGNTLLVPTGTVMDGALDQDITSDYTGTWLGHLTKDVYSIDNQYILLPKGTKISGQSLHIANVNEPIQDRMGLTVEWAILPNGKRIDFHKDTPEDQSGIAAFSGDVNRHLLAQFLSVAAYATINASSPNVEVNQYGTANPTFASQLAQGYEAALTPILMKYLSLVPTVTIPAGTPIKIITQDDMYIKPWAQVNTTIY